MIDVFRSLKSLLKVSKVRIDNTVLWLHYSFTVLMLLAFCIVITTKQYVGDPIDCVVGLSVSQSVVNTYCWIHTTYTVPAALTKIVGQEVPHPGIDNTTDASEYRYHKYYQWVCFVLFFQATVFYIPRWLWKTWEGGRIQALTMDMDVGICSDTEKKKKKRLLVDHLINYRGHHDWYAARFFFCELLALGNVVGQMFMLDKFFDGEFLNYGLEVINFYQMDPEDRVDPMIRIFPKVTKCKFFMYGPSANIQSVDALCLLPLNIINEKFYIIIWFWFLILGAITAAMICFHLLIIVFPLVRVYALNVRFPLTHLDQLHKIVSKFSIGDWFLIYMLGNNIDSVIFKEVIEDLACPPDGDTKECQPMVSSNC